MEWLKQKLCVFAMDAGANLQTGMISHLRSKEPNINSVSSARHDSKKMKAT